MFGKVFLTLAAVTGALAFLRRRSPLTTQEGVRERACALVREYIPCEHGDARYREMCLDYGGIGTTCGYLPSWLLWRMGAPSRFVNRSDPPTYSYKIGANISILRWHPEFHLYRTGESPLPGDIYFVSDGPSNTEHVGVYLGTDSTGAWTCADLGQTDGQGRQCGRITSRTLRSDGKLYRDDGIGAPRKLVGWLDLEEVLSSR